MRSIIVTIMAITGLSPAGCMQTTPDGKHNNTAKLNDTAQLKELVIRHVTANSGHVPPNAHFVIETFDRRAEMIAVTGMFRSTGNNDNRIGRFWVELHRAGSSWKPETIAIISTGDSNAQQIRWP